MPYKTQTGFTLMERFVLFSRIAADSWMNRDSSGIKLIRRNPEEVRERNGRNTAYKKGNQNRVHDLTKPDEPQSKERKVKFLSVLRGGVGEGE